MSKFLLEQVICAKCGRVADLAAAQTGGWLIAQRADEPEGRLIIRCPQHASQHARRLAGLPQQDRQRRIVEHIERGFVVERDGLTVEAVADAGRNPQHVYLLTTSDEHAPVRVASFTTLPELITAMREVEPDLRKWRLAEVADE